ncbi:hypothetical protein AX15_004927 [Amanita polypyramis BW_CC]|nr:hypothetical protein AX15_004927 [Amanita polypyramis BW_CC]
MFRRCLSSGSTATTITSLLRSTRTLRRLSTVTNDVPAADPEPTLKRFWKDVGIEKRGESYAVTLDKRPLKTSSGNTMLLPPNKTLVASLIAIEWENQEKIIKPHALTMSSLAARAIDVSRERRIRDEIQDSLLEYLKTDTICFYQEHPSHLVDLQTKHWDPLHTWIRQAYGVEIVRTNTILSSPQAPETGRKLRKILDDLNQWELAGLLNIAILTSNYLSSCKRWNAQL